MIESFGQHVSFFEGDGTFIRTWNIPSHPSYALTGNLFVWAFSPRASGSGFRRDETALIPGTAEGPGTDTLCVLVTREYVQVQSQAGGGVTSLQTVPLSRSDRVAVAPPDRIVTSGDGFELVLRPIGHQTPIRARIDREPRQVTSTEWDSALASSRRGIPNSRWRGQHEQALDEMERPDHMPAFDQLRIDTEGRAWVREYVAPWEKPPERTWWVFDRDGRWVTNVSIPADLVLLEIGRDRILVRWADELGVQRVRAYELLKEIS